MRASIGTESNPSFEKELEDDTCKRRCSYSRLSVDRVAIGSHWLTVLAEEDTKMTCVSHFFFFRTVESNENNDAAADAWPELNDVRLRASDAAIGGRANPPGALLLHSSLGLLFRRVWLGCFCGLGFGRFGRRSRLRLCAGCGGIVGRRVFARRRTAATPVAMHARESRRHRCEHRTGPRAATHRPIQSGAALAGVTAVQLQ